MLRPHILLLSSSSCVEVCLVAGHWQAASWPAPVQGSAPLWPRSALLQAHTTWRLPTISCLHTLWQVQEALDHMPSLLVFDDLDVLCHAESDGPEGAGAAADPGLVAWLCDVLDYLARPSLEWGVLPPGLVQQRQHRPGEKGADSSSQGPAAGGSGESADARNGSSVTGDATNGEQRSIDSSSGDGGGGGVNGSSTAPSPPPAAASGVEAPSASLLWPPVAVAATCKDPAALSAPLRAAGRLDHPVSLPAPSADSRAAILAAGVRARRATAALAALEAVAERADGFDAADLGVLLDRSMHLALRRRIAGGAHAAAGSTSSTSSTPAGRSAPEEAAAAGGGRQQEGEGQLAAVKGGQGIELLESDLLGALEGMTPAAFWGVHTQKSVQQVGGWCGGWAPVYLCGGEWHVLLLCLGSVRVDEKDVSALGRLEQWVGAVLCHAAAGCTSCTCTHAQPPAPRPALGSHSGAPTPLAQGVSGWEDVGGMDEVRQALYESLELPTKFPKLVAQVQGGWGLGAWLCCSMCSSGSALCLGCPRSKHSQRLRPQFRLPLSLSCLPNNPVAWRCCHLECISCTHLAPLPAQAPLRLRTGVLLYGPPGCGKTHVVSAAVAAANVRCITVSGPELLNKYIGARGLSACLRELSTAVNCLPTLEHTLRPMYMQKGSRGSAQRCGSAPGALGALCGEHGVPQVWTGLPSRAPHLRSLCDAASQAQPDLHLHPSRRRVRGCCARRVPPRRRRRTLGAVLRRV